MHFNFKSVCVVMVVKNLKGDWFICCVNNYGLNNFVPLLKMFYYQCAEVIARLKGKKI